MVAAGACSARLGGWIDLLGGEISMPERAAARRVMPECGACARAAPPKHLARARCKRGKPQRYCGRVQRKRGSRGVSRLQREFAPHHSLTLPTASFVCCSGWFSDTDAGRRNH
jgi:hypothetical protein